MTDFFRFPHTPHLAWLGRGQPRDDKLLTPDEVNALLASENVVEEKLDGANIGLSTRDDGSIRVQNRGQYLDLDHAHPQFRPLQGWLRIHEPALADALFPDLIIFGEWCYAVHSVVYDRLPNWFLGFDVYDRTVNTFWDTGRRNDLLAALGLSVVPLLTTGRFNLSQLAALLDSPSKVGSEPMEGIVVRQQRAGITTARAKLVRPEFAQAIQEHWSRGPLRRNEVWEGVTPRRR